MAVQTPCIFIQAGSHPAEDVRRALYAQLGLRGGIVQAGDLEVTQNGTPNMTVNVATGQVVVPGSEGTYQGAYICENRGSLSVSIAAADATNPRYDLIVARVRDAAYSGATNTFAIEAVTGTPAASPAEPTIPANSWVLARVEVVALDTTITTSNITDRRTTGTGQFGRAAALGGKIVCTSTTRPTAPFEGMDIYETDTDFEYTYSGSAWVSTAQLGAWTTYSPTLGQPGAVTYTATYARYQKIGRMVTVSVFLTVTGTGNAATKVTVSLPFTAVQAANMAVGSGMIVESSPAATLPGIVLIDSTTTAAMGPSNATTGNYLGVVQFVNALASGDIVTMTFTYESTT